MKPPNISPHNASGHPRRPGRFTWYENPIPRYMKHIRHRNQPGYGMGMGRNTLIHNGRKPNPR